MSPSRRARLLAGVAMLAVALAAGAAVGGWTELALAGIAAIIGAAFILCRLELAVAVLAASFFFTNYLNNGASVLSIDKALGLLAVTAWGLDWAVNRRPVVVTRQLGAIGAFLVWTGVSLVLARNDRAALITSLRYLTFATLYFLVLQAVRGNRRRADILVSVLLGAATVASIIGLAAFFGHSAPRASGPIGDPNDFGFVLGSSVPLAIYRLRWAAGRWGKAIWGAALIIILLCTLATFSRSALAGLAVASLWALLAGRLRARWLVVVAIFLAAAAGVALLLSPQLVQSAFGQKAHVAGQNVDTRIGFYRVEISEFEHSPITGVGPGNFVYRFFQYEPAARESLPYPSNVLTISGEEAYLVILAEQGAPGLLLFLLYLALSWSDLRRRFPGDQRADQLQAALAAGFVVAVVGALFLAEQYYPPLWFLPALAASMASGLRGTGGAPDAPAGDLRAVTSGAAGAGTLVPGGRR